MFSNQFLGWKSKTVSNHHRDQFVFLHILVFFLTKNDFSHIIQEAHVLKDDLTLEIWMTHSTTMPQWEVFFGNLLHQMILPCFFHVPVISAQQSSPIWPKLKQRLSILRQDSRSNMSPFYVCAVKANFLTTSASLWQVAGGAIRCKALILAREILRWPFSKAISCSGWYRHQPW